MNRMQIIRIAVVALLIVVSAIGCSDEERIDVSSPDFEKFTDVYSSLLIGFELAGHDSTAYMPIRDSILASFRTDTTWMDSYIKKIGDDPESWLVVWKDIAAKLDARRDSLTP